MSSESADTASDSVAARLNEIISTAWTAYAQPATHATLVESWGLRGLAASMRSHIADEPGTIQSALERLVAIEGHPDLHLGELNIGTTLREVLDNDMRRQLLAPGLLNQAAQNASTAHDATTRRVVEGILAGEEEHLDWLRTELELLDKLGESLYVAGRLQPLEEHVPAQTASAISAR